MGGCIVDRGLVYLRSPGVLPVRAWSAADPRREPGDVGLSVAAGGGRANWPDRGVPAGRGIGPARAPGARRRGRAADGAPRPGILRFHPYQAIPEVWRDAAPRILFTLDPQMLARERYLRDRFATGPMPISCDTHALGHHSLWGPLSAVRRSPARRLRQHRLPYGSRSRGSARSVRRFPRSANNRAAVPSGRDPPAGRYGTLPARRCRAEGDREAHPRSAGGGPDRAVSRPAHSGEQVRPAAAHSRLRPGLR